MKLSKRIFRRAALALALPVAFAINALAEDASPRPDKSANKPAVVVYPVAMTNVGAANASIAPAREPVVEAREFEIDTPIGQVRNVLKTLEELRAGQNRELQTLEALRQTTQSLVGAQRELIAAVARLETNSTAAEPAEEIETKAAIAPIPQEPVAPSRYETLWSLARAVAALAILGLLLRGVKSAIQEAREKSK